MLVLGHRPVAGGDRPRGGRLLRPRRRAPRPRTPAADAVRWPPVPPGRPDGSSTTVREPPGGCRQEGGAGPVRRGGSGPVGAAELPRRAAACRVAVSAPRSTDELPARRDVGRSRVRAAGAGPRRECCAARNRERFRHRCFAPPCGCRRPGGNRAEDGTRPTRCSGGSVPARIAHPWSGPVRSRQRCPGCCRRRRTEAALGAYRDALATMDSMRRRGRRGPCPAAALGRTAKACGESARWGYGRLCHGGRPAARAGSGFRSPPPRGRDRDTSEAALAGLTSTTSTTR